MAPGDGVANCALLFQRVFRGWGLESQIHAENVAAGVSALPLDKMSAKFDQNVGLLLHHSIGSPVAEKFASSSALKILFYQNITPPDVLRDAPGLAARAVQGLQQLPSLARKSDIVLASSSFSAQTLRRLTQKVGVVPLGISADNAASLSKARDQHSRASRTFLHVGRIVPHKAIEDIIRAFTVYQRTFCPEAALVLAGSAPLPQYQQALQNLVNTLGAENVEFTGNVDASKLTRLYATSTIYLCASRHEGFCLPLVESMFAELPVISFYQPAVAETLGNAGIVLPGRDPFLMAEAMNMLLTSNTTRETIRNNQCMRRELFSEAGIGVRLRTALSDLL